MKAWAIPSADAWPRDSRHFGASAASARSFRPQHALLAGRKTAL